MLGNLDALTIFLLVIICTVAVGGILVTLVSRAVEFRHELNLIKMEISRTRGEEQQYWKKQKLRLWLSFILFKK